MNYIDTRDLYTRKCELEALRDALTEARGELAEAREALADHDTADNRISHFDWEGGLQDLRGAVADAESALESAESEYGEDEAGELAELEELESEISDFRHGETMIPVDRFTEYAQELAQDLGYMDRKGADKWPFTCIDWEEAAKELSQDYTEVSYQGQDYYVRS